MRERIDRALVAQARRRELGATGRNARLPDTALEAVCRMTSAARRALGLAAREVGLSSRASAAVMKVARTIADLDGDDTIVEDHLLEAVQHRRRGEDLSLWG
jgi:magnesium chelatase family protein